MKNLIALVLLIVCFAPATFGQNKFQFGSSPAADGFTLVSAGDSYSKDRGYGFESESGAVTALAKSITSDKPIYFSVALPEGSYRVTVTLGNSDTESTTTVKAELRRLMLQSVHTDPGQAVTRTFAVNIRRPQYPGGTVRLKAPRETTQEAWAWDDKLTLEFTDSHPSVSSIEITPANDLPVIYIAGDSTSTDQSREPYDSWGQMLTRFFTPDVVIANHGESGESTNSFFGERRWPKLLSVFKQGDYLLIQFGHNDEKDRGPTAGAFKNFKSNLERMVKEASDHGVTPILVTPMHRRTFDSAGKITNSHGDYLEAVRTVAKDQGVALIDLADMSKALYEALGQEKSGLLFAGKDTTHQSDYGSYELAKCIVEGIRQSGLPIAKFIVSDEPVFDPGHPDAFEEFKVPADPVLAATSRPAGS